MTDETCAPKILTVALSGRDDDYMLDFRYRLATTISYLARNLQRLGRLDDVEVLFADWGSDPPLARSLTLDADSARLTRFVHVPQSVTREIRGTATGYHTAMALNVSIRRARGEYILVTGSDTLISQGSLDCLLKVLSGVSPVPFAPERTYMQLRRNQISWRFVHRRPTRDEFDRYLLLNPMGIPDPHWARFSLGEGSGGILVHRSRWHELRGVDERMAGYGRSDFDLCMRVSQQYPWVELSGLGVILYHMEHAPYGRRADLSTAQHPPDRKLVLFQAFQANDENWGLGDRDLEVQIPQPTSESPAAGAHERERGATTNDESVGRSVPTGVCRPEVRRQARRIVEHFLLRKFAVEEGEIRALLLLSWYTLHRNPRIYLEFGIRRGYAAALVAAIQQDVEMYGIELADGFSGKDGPHILTKTLLDPWPVGYHGYCRFVIGDITTAVERLRDSFVGPFRFDLALFRTCLFADGSGSQLHQLLSHLAPGGALVMVAVNAGLFATLWADAQASFDGYAFWHCDDGITGIIIHEDAAGAGTDPVRGGIVPLDVSWFGRSRLRCRAIRVYGAVKRPLSRMWEGVRKWFFA